MAILVIPGKSIKVMFKTLGEKMVKLMGIFEMPLLVPEKYLKKIE